MTQYNGGLYYNPTFGYAGVNPTIADNYVADTNRTVVGTLHDYTLVCVSGGQRVHAAEQHVCETIDADRCSRCFAQSPFAGQLAAGRVMQGKPGRAIGRAAAALRGLAPRMTEAAARQLGRLPVDAAQIRRRLSYARHVFDTVDLFVAPSASMADEFVRLGATPDRLAISDYGFAAANRRRTNVRGVEPPLRIGFVGTLVWHKGAHVLLDAARGLTGAFELHVHGDVSTFPSYVARLREAARGLPVTFHGAFDRVSADVYEGLDVLVVPSLWPENSPLVIHEAFLHGIPVVGARGGGIPELVVDGVSGLLYEPSSSAALRAALQWAIDEPSILQRLSEGAPPVKSIAQDAREWDARYAALVDAPAPARVGP